MFGFDWLSNCLPCHKLRHIFLRTFLPISLLKFTILFHIFFENTQFSRFFLPTCIVRVHNTLQFLQLDNFSFKCSLFCIDILAKLKNIILVVLLIYSPWTNTSQIWKPFTLSSCENLEICRLSSCKCSSYTSINRMPH